MANENKAKIGVDVEGLDALRQYAGDLGKVNKQLRDQAKELKILNKIQGEALIKMQGYDKAGQKVISTFKVMDKYAKLLNTTITKLSSTQKRNSEQYAVIRAEIAAYNAVKKQTTDLEKIHAIALARNASLLKSQRMGIAKAEVAAYAEQKKRVIALERQHAVALQANIRIKARTAAAATKVATVQRKTVDTTRAMIKSQKDLILSTKGVERVLSILIIRRIFHQLITQMREAITTTMDFQKALTEIQTISQTAPASLDKWADSIIRVSNAWDIDLLDAANARYQILSNQVAKTAGETERFSETAFEFAKITKATATSAVDLLSSALNAYGDSAVNADKMSAQLFKTIELGRIRSEDISSSFGRIVVVAAQLGIELAEVGAMMAIITNKGVKATESMTLLRGVTMKLIKPTKDMKTLFAEWGVQTGEQAIATFGLLGVMQKLEEATRGSASEIGALFGRIRATMGVTALVSDLEKFNDVLIQIRDTSAESYAKAAAMQFQTAGEQLSKELNLLKNTLVQGIGTDVVESLAEYNKGLITITNTVTTLIKVGTNLGIAIGLIWTAKRLHTSYLFLTSLRSHIFTYQLYTAGAISAVSATEALVAVQAAASFGITLAIYGTVTALRAMYNSAKETREALEALDQQYQDLVANQVSATKKQRTEYEKSVEAFRVIGQQALQQNAKIVASSNKMTTSLEDRIELEKDWIKEHQKLVENDVKVTIENYTEMYDTLIDEAEKYAKQIAKIEKQRLKTQEDFVKIIEEATREKLTPAENLKRLKEQYETTKALRKADVEGGEKYQKIIQKELGLWQDIFELQKEIEKARKTAAVQAEADNRRRMNRMLGIRGTTRQRKVDDQVDERLTDEFISVVKELAKASEVGYVSSLSKLEDYYTTANDLAEKLAKKYQGILDIFNEMMAQLKKPEIMGLSLDETKLKAIQEAIVQGKPITVDASDIKTQVQEFIKIFNIIDPIQSTIDALAEHQKVVEENTKALMATIKAQTKELTTAQIRGKEAENKLGDALGIVDKTLDEMVILMKEIKKLERISTPGLIKTLSSIGLIADTRIEMFLESVQEAAENISKADEMSMVEKLAHADSLRAVMAHMDVFIKFIDKSELLGFEKLREAFKKSAIVIEDQVKETAEAAEALKEANAGIPLIKETLDNTMEMLKDIRINAQMFRESTKLYEISIKSLNATQMVEFRTLMQTFNMELTAVNAALRQFSLDRAAGMAMGGSVWGTDTVPVRLTPGEFVVNQRSAKKFYGMLTSMNSGGSAVQGDDYSTTIGDISITVPGAGTSRQNVQEIMSGLRREIHRGKLARI